MLKLKHSSKYWKKNFQVYKLDKISTPDNWNNFVNILARYPKKINLNEIIKYFERIKNRTFRKLFMDYNKDEDIKALKEHVSFITYLYDQEKKRQENIDNKARQIITNVSLIFTFIAFSSAIILVKDNYVQTTNNFSIFAVGFALLFALIAIIIAVYCLDFKKYNRPLPDQIFNKENRAEDKYFKQKITSFYYALSINTDTNEHKTYLVKLANYLLIISIFLIGVFTMLNLYSIKLRNEKPKEKTIQEVKLKDTVYVYVIKPIELNYKDTLKVKSSVKKNK